ncbi:MAG: exodeoxyribonuclease VII large subunit [Lachnospiraceae bacterium]|nr:exodeoxyribonuclease VII large subunit [Lachnospiraceae bacterium]
MAVSVYSVSQISGYIKNMFVTDYLLNQVCVKGEISNCKYHYSGHIYFTLKDEGASLSCVMFSASRKGLGFKLEEGMQVKVTGQISTYEKGSSYELFARLIEQDGRGDLYMQYELLKKELEERGLFADEYKQPIPKYITRLGVVTASTGAAIHDIINISSRRNPYVQVYLYPAQVQGEGAAATIVKGIETLDAMGLDCIIVGRGGGSIEDLWAFNEEIVAQAVFDCGTPVISAVGHETDFTIVDFVADLRAPTPSAAAELAVFDYKEFIDKCESYRRRMSRVMERELSDFKNRISLYKLMLEKGNPSNRLIEQKRRLIDLNNRIDNIMMDRLGAAKHRLAVLSERLNGNSPLTKISSGYAFVTLQNGERLKSVAQVSAGDRINISLADGQITAVAAECRKSSVYKA